MSFTQFLQQIATLSSPFEATTVAASLGLDLEADEAASNEYFSIHRAPGPLPGVVSVEVRQPTSASAGKGGMVLVTLEGADPAELSGRFGPKQAGPPTIPSPRAPADSPRYDIHTTAWGVARLGYRPSDGLLVSVVLDAN